MNTATEYLEKINLLSTSYCTNILHTKIFGNCLEWVYTCKVFCFESNADFFENLYSFIYIYIYIYIYVYFQDNFAVTLLCLHSFLSLLFKSVDSNVKRLERKWFYKYYREKQMSSLWLLYIGHVKSPWVLNPKLWDEIN